MPKYFFGPLHDLEVKGRLRRVEQRYWTRLQICWLFDYKPWIAQSQKDRVEKHCLISSPYGHHLTECLGFWNNSNHRSVHCSRQRMHEKNLQCSKAHTHTPSTPIKLSIKCHYIKLLLGKCLWKKLWRIVHTKKHTSTINWRKYIAHFMHLEFALPAKSHHKIKIDKCYFFNGMQYLLYLTHLCTSMLIKNYDNMKHSN